MLPELQQDLTALREANAYRLDPARFRFIESLLERAAHARAPVQDILQNKANAALSAYCADQQSAAENTELKPAARYKSTVAKLLELRQILDQKQPAFNSTASALERQLQEQENQSLAAAVYSVDALAEQDQKVAATGQKPLKASQKMQVFQQRRAIERRVEIAIQQGPESPGPLNPQMLALKSLTAMRDLSPLYLNRYVNYLDALFWIDNATVRSEVSKPAKKPRKTTRRK
jgi:hypothetical protein